MNKRFWLVGILTLLIIFAGAFVFAGCTEDKDGDEDRSDPDNDDDDASSGDDDDDDNDTGDDDTGDDDDNDTAPVVENLLLIYYSNLSQAEDLQEVLEDFDYTVTLLKEQDITLEGISGYDMIVLSGNTLWSNTANASLVKNTGVPIFGIYRGGARFFDVFGFDLGFAGGITFDFETQVIAADQGHEMWDTPNAITVPSSGLVSLFASIQFCHGVPLNPVPATVEVLGYVATSASYTSLGVENSRYFYWGYETIAGDLTSTGRDVLENAIAFLATR